MLTITKLKGAEYLIRSVADGMEDYYMGAGEAPGVWRGAWAADLGLDGIVEADALRALVDGVDPGSGMELLAGHRERRVKAIDVTLSPAKSVSLLWAFGTPETSAAVSIAVVEATEVALGFLEERAAVARRQEGGIRRRVATAGFAIATFAHRTSRAGDPQLHTHCLIPNVVRRADGVFVAFDANPLHTWAKAAGTVFQNELQRVLTRRLGVAWGPARNGTREMVGFTRDQLRAFSKRTTAIETRLEARGELAFESKRARMRADDRASIRTRDRKDKTLTPERLRDRWVSEAATLGLEPGVEVDRLVLGRSPFRSPALTDPEMIAALVDPATGLCAAESRFGEAHVVERVAALSAGRLGIDEILAVTRRFIDSDLVVRLVPDAARRRSAEWSTIELRRVEDRLLANLEVLVRRPAETVGPGAIEAAVKSHPSLGGDQVEAVMTLSGAGPAVRLLVAPAGFGKTATVAAAVSAETLAGRPVVAVAPTHRAVAELRAAGLDAQTIARFRRSVNQTPLAAETTVVVDELSQVGTRDAAVIVAAVAATPDARVWFAGDGRQAQPVAAGGLAAELERLAASGQVPSASLVVNRRQRDPVERTALARFRAGDVDASQAIRSENGWEHQHASPTETRHGLAEAAVVDADRHGPDQVAVLAVSHADCEDLADRIRAIRAARGELRGPTLTGPSWGPNRRMYAPGDRVLVHANLGPDQRLFNGASGTVISVTGTGLDLVVDGGGQVHLPAEAVSGRRPDGAPILSHAWARTVDGAQGGTWTQVHLLGTPALDRYTGYVGQSRGRRPTHTWNTRPEPDHPAHLLVDQRPADEVVLDALRRAEPKTLAAGDDPWSLDRRLRTEREDHLAVIGTRPPDPGRELETARWRLRLADDELRGATGGVDRFRSQRERLGPLARLRRGGRAASARVDVAPPEVHQRLARAERARADADADLVRLQRAVTERAVWDKEHAWRLGRIAEIDETLARHWAAAVLRAVRADDPLAFGMRRLRDARDVYRSDLARLLVVDEPLPRGRDAVVRAMSVNATRRRRAWLEGAVRDLDHGLEARVGPGRAPEPGSRDSRLTAAVDRALAARFGQTAVPDRSSIDGDMPAAELGGRGLGIEL
ncbi:MAG: MobF family relaxase [Acidimicrobiales bacterium]